MWPAGEAAWFASRKACRGGRRSRSGCSRSCSPRLRPPRRGRTPPSGRSGVVCVVSSLKRTSPWPVRSPGIRPSIWRAPRSACAPAGYRVTRGIVAGPADNMGRADLRAKCCGCTEAFQASRAGSIPVARSGRFSSGVRCLRSCRRQGPPGEARAGLGPLPRPRPIPGWLRGSEERHQRLARHSDLWAFFAAW